MAGDGLARIDLASTTSVSKELALAGMAEWENSGIALLKAFLYQFQTSVQLPLTVAAFNADTAGSGIALDATTTAAVKVYSDDNGAAIGSGTMVRAGEFRHLQTDVTGNREEEAVGVIGKLVSVAGVNRHNMCGVMGSYEMKGTIVVDGQIATTDAWIQAGVIGRVGMSTGTVTLNTYGVLAGVAAMSNIAAATTATYTGNYVGYYAGRWGTADKFGYGLYFENVTKGGYMSSDSGDVAGSEIGFEVAHTGALSGGGDYLIGQKIGCTATGDAGTAAIGLFCSLNGGATKTADGYLAAGEFETIISHDENPASTGVILLDFANTGGDHMHNAEKSAFICVQDWGTYKMQNLFSFWDGTGIIATNDHNKLLSTTADDPACDATIRITIGTTPYWIMLTADHAA